MTSLRPVLMYKELYGGRVFDDDTRGPQGSTFVDSLDSSGRPRSADDSFHLANRITSLENDVAAKAYEIEALRDQAWIIPVLTLWRPLLPYGYSYKESCARPGEAVICNFWHPDTLALSPERQSVRMSKITNHGLTRSGTTCFIANVGVKGSVGDLLMWY